MSDNVISFAERLAQRRGTSHDDPRAAEKKHQAAERMRLRGIQTRYEKRGEGGLLKFSREDTLLAAQALGKLIEKAGKPAAGKPEVTIDSMKKKWRDVYNNSEFHIHRYMISPEIDLTDPQIVDEQPKKTRSVGPYAKRARFIAELAELDPEESEIAIFRNTALWQNWGRSASKNDRAAVVDEAAVNVASLIERLSARIIRDTNLADLFARMRRIPGQWDIRTECFRASSMACLFRSAYQDWNEYWSEAPPLPSVPLVRLWHEGLSFPVRLSSEASTELIAAHAMLAPVTPEEGDERAAELHIYREIRLALGPTVNADALGPMFESRVYAELSILDGDGKISSQGVLGFDSNWDLSGLSPERSAAVLLDDRWHRVTPLAVMKQPEENFSNMMAALSGQHVESPFLWDQTPLADNKQCVEHYYFSWTPVDAAHVGHWLDRLEDGRSQPVEFLPGAREPKSDTSTWYPRPFLAGLVETAIADGRLEAALRSETARVHDVFENYERDWRTRMQEQTAEQIAEFDSDLTTANTHPNQQMETNNDQQS